MEHRPLKFRGAIGKPIYPRNMWAQMPEWVHLHAERGNVRKCWSGHRLLRDRQDGRVHPFRRGVGRLVAAVDEGDDANDRLVVLPFYHPGCDALLYHAAGWGLRREAFKSVEGTLFDALGRVLNAFDAFRSAMDTYVPSDPRHLPSKSSRRRVRCAGTASSA